jgi:tetratricopeptide (TPR) repeat protein
MRLARSTAEGDSGLSIVARECTITVGHMPPYLEQAIAYYREAIRYYEQAGDLYGAAWTRENVAITYVNAGRFEDALLFAHAALRNYQQFGPAVAAEVARAQQVIAWIEEKARGKRGE